MSSKSPALRFATDRQRDFVSRACEVLDATVGVVGASVAGSLARGDADEWSDVDLNVFVDPEHAEALWESRGTTLSRCGHLALITDLSALVADSCMAFFASGVKAHVTYKTLAGDANRSDRFGDIAVCGTLSVVEHVTPSSSERADEVFSAPDVPHDPEMFTFWMMRVVVAAARDDELSGLESRLQLLELVFAELALRRRTDYHGVRKAHQYLHPDELLYYTRFARLQHAPELFAQLAPMSNGYLLDDDGEPHNDVCAAAVTACAFLLREGQDRSLRAEHEQHD